MHELTKLTLLWAVISLLAPLLALLTKKKLLLQFTGGIATFFGILALTSLFASNQTIFGMVYLLVVLFGIFNALRLVLLRQPAEYLTAQAPRDAVGLLLLLALSGLLMTYAQSNLQLETVFGATAAWFFLGCSLALLGSVLRSRWRFSPPPAASNGGQLPTLTLAIPARNETKQLVDSLNSALSQDYDRIEIIVFDDFSHDKTPEILADFARRGVRFVRGTKPANGWLGKNLAYKTLSEQASGDYILFCGADVRLGRLTARNLVRYMQKNEVEMVSLMPLQKKPINTLRYQWQLLLPHVLRRTPPVLGTIWCIKRDALSGLGGIAGLKAAVVPERYLARSLAPSGKYRFFFAHGSFHAGSVKNYRAQIDTQIRMYYPLLRRSLTLAAVASAYMIFGIIVPIFTVIGWLFMDLSLSWQALALSGLVSLVALILATSSCLDRKLWKWQALLPLLMLREAELLLRSTLQYEFSEVWWKGRNVSRTILGGRSRH